MEQGGVVYMYMNQSCCIFHEGFVTQQQKLAKIVSTLVRNRETFQENQNTWGIVDRLGRMKYLLLMEMADCLKPAGMLSSSMCPFNICKAVLALFS